MEHPADDKLAAFALEILAPAEHDEVSAHLEACATCARAAGEYLEIRDGLRTWREAPPQVAFAAQDTILQRIKLHRLFDRLLADAGVRRQAGEDPAGLLIGHGISPTAELLAAFKDWGATPERFPHELDERMTKLRRLLEWFPGAPPPLSG